MLGAEADRAEGAEGPLLSVIVVSYNTRQMTLDCLRSLVETAAELSPEILVVDNASADGSAEAIAAGWPAGCASSPLRLIPLDRNIGFAAANNLAAAQARGRYLLLLNPDTVVLPGAVQALLEFAARRPQAGIWGGRTLFADGRLNPNSCFARQSPWSLTCIALGLHRLFPASCRFNGESYGGWRRDSERGVDIVSGCFLLIGRELWERLGGFDLRFFVYAEEADLCLRAHALGARPAITPSAEIVHHGGASQAVRADRLARLFAGKITLIEKHWSPAAAMLGRGLYRLMVLVRIAGLAVPGWVGNRPRAREGMREWVRLWRARGTWLRGWPPPATGALAPPAATCEDRAAQAGAVTGRPGSQEPR